MSLDSAYKLVEGFMIFPDGSFVSVFNSGGVYGWKIMEPSGPLGGLELVHSARGFSTARECYRSLYEWLDLVYGRGEWFRDDLSRDDGY